MLRKNFSIFLLTLLFALPAVAAPRVDLGLTLNDVLSYIVEFLIPDEATLEPESLTEAIEAGEQQEADSASENEESTDPPALFPRIEPVG